jgi:hypothetical protein
VLHTRACLNKTKQKAGGMAAVVAHGKLWVQSPDYQKPNQNKPMTIIIIKIKNNPKTCRVCSDHLWSK